MAKTDDFKAGDTVKLKSGSPVMTVTDSEKDGNNKWVSTSFWNKERGEFQAETFKGAALTSTEASDGE